MGLYNPVAIVREMMGRSPIRTPGRRECEQCGRREAWDESVQSWSIANEGETRAVGDPLCIHEWDINGTFSPYE